jgi:hypothetical protein
LPHFHLPKGHLDAKSAPRNLKAGLLLAEKFCKGEPWEGDAFARRAATAQCTAENAASVRNLIKFQQDLPTMPDWKKQAALRTYGKLGALTLPAAEAAYAAAMSVACVLRAVCLVTFMGYEESPHKQVEILQRVPEQVAASLGFGQVADQDLQRLVELSPAVELPLFGTPVDPSETGPLGPIVA